MAVQKIGLEAVLEMGSFSANLKGYISGVNQMSAQTDKAAASAARAGPSFASFTSAMSNIGRTVSGAAQPFLTLGDAVLKFGMTAAGVAAGGVAALAVGIAGLGVASTKMAADFDAGMRNVNAIAQLPEDQFQALSDEVVNFSLTTRSSAEDLSRGLYNVVSAGQSLTDSVSVPITKVRELADGSKELYTETLNTSEGMAVLQLASRAAGAGLATVDDTSRLLISAMGSYGMSVEEGGRVTDLFLYAVNKGITTLPQLTNELGTVFPTAHALGISLEEVTAGTVLLTRKGLSTAEATTAINQAMTGLIKPSKELTGFLQENGYESGMAAVKALGFAGVMELLANSTGGAKEELALMFGNIRAERAVFSLATDGAKELRDMVKDFEENAAGAVELARIEQYKSLAANLAKLKNAFAAIGITIGKEFLPYVVDAVKAFQPMVVAFGKKLPDAIAIFKNMLAGIFSGKGLPGLSAMTGIRELGALFGIPPEVTESIAQFTVKALQLADVVRGYLVKGFEYFQSTILPALVQAFQWVIANADSFMGALYGIGALLAGSAILSAVVSIGAALAALVTPVGLIIAAAALLGAAWNANWYGMRDTLTAFWSGTALPALQQLWAWLQTNLPIAIAYLSNLWTNTLLPALQAGGNFMLTVVVPAIQQVYAWLAQNLPIAIAAASAFITGTLIPALQQAWTWLSTNIPTAIATVNSYWAAMQVAIQAASDFLTGVIGPALNNAATTINGVLTPALQANSAFWGMIGAAINSVATWINTYLMPAFIALGGVITSAVNLALTALAGLIQNVVWPAFVTLGTFIQSVFQPVLAAIGLALTPIIESLGLVGTTVTGNTMPALTLLGGAVLTLANAITNVLGLAIQIIVNTTLAQFQAGLKGIQDAITWVTGKLDELKGRLDSVQLPGWLQPGSPTPFELGLLGIASALSGKVTKAFEQFSALAPPAFKALAESVVQIQAGLNDMAEGTLNQFTSAMGSAGAAMVSNFEEANSYAAELAGTLADLRSSLSAVSSYAQSAGTSFSSFNDAAGNIYGQLVPALQSLVEWLNQVADAASAAASNVGDVGSSAGGAGGPGFQHGANFIVPSGFSNDSFPFRAETGERVIVMPRPLANQPVAAAGGGVGGVNLIFENVTITTGMDLEMFGAFVERRVARAMGGA